MKKASRLYNALVIFLGQSQQWADVRHLYVLAWMVVGLIGEGSVNLTRWIMSVQSRAKLAQSTQRRFQRWLYNPRINVQRLYSPLIQHVLAQEPVWLWGVSVLTASDGTSSAVKPSLCKLSESMVCVSILKKTSWMTSPMALSWNAL